MLSCRFLSFALIMLACLSLKAQDSAVKVINHVSFPYKKGYNMHFKGRQVHYEYDDQYLITGKPKEVSDSYSFYYHITDEWIEKGDTLVNFYVQQNSVNDTSRMYTSPLLFNDDGMFCWFVRNPNDSHSPKDVKKYMKTFHLKKQKDTVWHTISTPLYEGKIWRGLVYDFSDGIYTCVTLDTVIHTDLGDLHCFCIKAYSSLKMDKNEALRNVYTECYAAEVGKVYSAMESFLVIDDTKVYPVGRLTATVDKIWWDDPPDDGSIQK